MYENKSWHSLIEEIFCLRHENESQFEATDIKSRTVRQTREAKSSKSSKSSNCQIMLTEVWEGGGEEEDERDNSPYVLKQRS